MTNDTSPTVPAITDLHWEMKDVAGTGNVHLKVSTVVALDDLPDLIRTIRKVETDYWSEKR